LQAADPADEVWRCHSDFQSDPTIAALASALPDDATVAVIGWPERIGQALVRRGDVSVRVVDATGDGAGFARTLERADVAAEDVAIEAMAPAVASADLLVLEASALGGSFAACALGSWAAAAVAASSDTDVWVVAGRGRVMPPRLWAALAARLEVDRSSVWDLGLDLVPLALAASVAGERGLEVASTAAANADVPDVAELRR
jgi:hypothetical protein